MNEQELQRRHDAIVAKSLREELSKAELAEYVAVLRDLNRAKAQRKVLSGSGTERR